MVQTTSQIFVLPPTHEHYTATEYYIFSVLFFVFIFLSLLSSHIKHYAHILSEVKLNSFEFVKSVACQVQKK
jgi:hypothetical protein